MRKKTRGPSRTWIKLYTTECLRGSIRDTLTVEQRSVWYDLLLMAGDSREDGIICATKGVPYPHRRIAQMLGIPSSLLGTSLKKFTEQGRISEDGDGIHITKWQVYQATYQPRLKGFEEGEEPEPAEELSSERLARQAELDSKLPKRELRKLSPERQEAAKAYREDPDKFIKGRYGHMVRR